MQFNTSMYLVYSYNVLSYLMSTHCYELRKPQYFYSGLLYFNIYYDLLCF